MTRAELEEVGNTLFGEHWRIKLAKAIGCDRSAVTRWMTGERNISRLAETSIRELAKHKAHD